MSLNYTLIAEVDDIGFLSPPFPGDVVPDLFDRIWIDRGVMINRYSGSIDLLTDPIGFGEGIFGEGLFGWS
ncbi:MAG: hypothetical protein K9M75_01525 [Phycisphaerae bacterium]|nr:hypothetical protein [Phycisphaerae bacterium]